MRLSEFDYDLPEELIAQHPPTERSASRLLVLRPGNGVVDSEFRALPDWLRAGDLLVFNDTRVIPARLVGRKATGGRVEVLIERRLGGGRIAAQVRASRTPAEGSLLYLGEETPAEVVGREGDFHILAFAGEAALDALINAAGEVPLPPYIRRRPEAVDRERYQTVYARAPGAVAAPTAGLHFDEPLLTRLAAAGIATATITLHVGAGTFQPVRTETIENHRMHSEYLEVPEDAVGAVKAARDRGGRVFAVGTTAVRALESAAGSGELAPFAGDSELFIYPGYQFRVVDGLVTNFHLPRSSLLMLVSALTGRQRLLAAYRHAVEQRYRFFSYGDAMLILPPELED